MSLTLAFLSYRKAALHYQLRKTFLKWALCFIYKMTTVFCGWVSKINSPPPLNAKHLAMMPGSAGICLLALNTSRWLGNNVHEAHTPIFIEAFRPNVYPHLFWLFPKCAQKLFPLSFRMRETVRPNLYCLLWDVIVCSSFPTFFQSQPTYCDKFPATFCLIFFSQVSQGPIRSNFPAPQGDRRLGVRWPSLQMAKTFLDDKKTRRDCEALQRDLSKLGEWAAKWQMLFSGDIH